MNCYFTCQKSKFSKTCFTTTKETALAPFNLLKTHSPDTNDVWRMKLILVVAPSNFTVSLRQSPRATRNNATVPHFTMHLTIVEICGLCPILTDR